MANIFRSIYQSGQDFAEKNLLGFFKGADADEQKGKAGIAALAIGGVVKGASIIVMGIGIISALANPVTGVAVAGYAATGLLSAAGLAYGMGLQKGGDNLSGLLTFRNELRKGVIEAVREDFRGWRNRKLGKSFDSAATPAQPAAATPDQPAAAPASAPAAPLNGPAV